MKRILVLALLLMVLAAILAGCGGNGDAVNSTNGNGGGGTSDGGPVGQAEAATCTANRSIISGAARQYQAMEGAYPNSLQQMVPGYLQSVPVCPSGGAYTLQGSTVTCSVHGK